MARWQCKASAVTTQPSSWSSSMSSSAAPISLRLGASRLGQRHAGLSRPDLHHDAGHETLAAFVGAPQRFAVDRDDALVPVLLQAPFPKAAMKLAEGRLEGGQGIEQAEDPARRCRGSECRAPRRRTCRSRGSLAEPNSAISAQFWAPHSVDSQRNEQQLQQIVTGVVRPRVRNIRKALVKSIHRCLPNKETPSKSCSPQTASPRKSHMRFPCP